MYRIVVQFVWYDDMKGSLQGVHLVKLVEPRDERMGNKKELNGSRIRRVVWLRAR